MAAGFNIKVDSKAFEKGLFAMRKQIPFAMAKAITATAKDCQAALKTGLASDFTIRTKWVEGGIRIKRAEKIGLTAEVGSVDPFMLLQEEGGTKAAGKKDMGIPVNDMRGADNMGVTTPDKWPKALMGSKGKGQFFLGHFKTGKGFVGQKIGAPQARQRIHKGHTGPVFPREPMRIVYLLSKSVTIKPRWDFWPTVEHVANDVLEKRSIEAIDEAIRTAR